MFATVPLATLVQELSSSGATSSGEALASLMKRHDEPMPMSPVWNQP